MRHVLAIFLFCLAVGAFADESGHPVTLWEARGESNSIYILGSIHLLRSEDYPLPTIIDTVYDDAEILIMELDMDDLDSVYMQTAMNQAGLLTDGRTLRDVMGEELYAQAEAAAIAANVPLHLLEKTEPWLASMTAEILILGRLGFNPMIGVEMKFTQQAIADGKPIEGFETIDEQLGFLDNLPLDAQREMLLQTLTEGANLGESIEVVLTAWRYGDIETLEREILSELEKQPELYDALIVNRNRRWVDSIEDLLDDEEDYLIIVGALHLVGKDGVPALLADKGIGIHQLRESD